MNTSRKFHLADLVSITTSFLIPSPGRAHAFDGVSDIVCFMTGEDLDTIAIRYAADDCKPALIKQHPFLSQIDMSGTNGSNWQGKLAQLVAEYGEYFEVSPLSAS